MKHVLGGAIVLAVGICLPAHTFAESIIDALDKELSDVKHQHDDATTQNLSNFFNQVDQAMGSPDAAVTLWQQAGGPMPAPTPVTTSYDNETNSERDARLAKDKANAEVLGNLIQVHCGLMHYAALFVTEPKRKGLQDDFKGWLQRAAQAYPLLNPPASDATGGGNSGNPPKHKRRDDGGGNGQGGNGGGNAAPPVKFSEVKATTMKDSVISTFLAFKSWGDNDQGSWSVKGIPDLFKTNILDPSRTTPSSATLQAWDIYIAMKQADEPDTDKWTSTDYPPLQFDRAMDAYTITPTTDSLQVLVQIIHANPTDPNADNWIKRTKALLDAYRAGHGGAVIVAPSNVPATVTTGNVTVTTRQAGDAQIITTTTNGAPANPRP
jgi:hypothetical protein